MTAVAVALTAVAISIGLPTLATMVSAVITDRVTKRLRNRDGSETKESAAPSRWWRAVPIYALLAPVVLLYGLLYELGVTPDSDVGVVLAVLGLLVLLPLSITTLVALFIDVTEPRTGWVPSLGIYVGVPIALYALVYLASASLGGIKPSGDAMYGFIVALWVVSAVYLANRYRHTGTLQLRGG